MANKACLARLRKELRAFDPPPFIRAAPLESNIQEWHYVLQGPPDSPYEGGLYHGKLKFPDDFPFRPPSIYMITPNGRFETDRRLCLSISDFHPESWVPTWSVSTILTGVLSFMLDTAPTTGAIETDDATKHRFRDRTKAFNAKDAIFCRLFPDLVSGQLFYDPSPSTATAPTAVESVDRVPAPVGAIEDATGRRATGEACTQRAAGALQGMEHAPREHARSPPSNEMAACDVSAKGMRVVDREWDGSGGATATQKELGKNAAKNKKKREKERQRKQAAAASEGGGSSEGGGGSEGSSAITDAV